MERLFYLNDKNFRYERKFYITDFDKKVIETIIRRHPAAFSMIYYPRSINNIYFDSSNLKHYYDNVNGLSQRLKVRIRWYGPLFGLVSNPVLELKLKHNLHVGKLSYPLKSFELNQQLTREFMQKIFHDSDLPPLVMEHVLGLKFSLLNRYQRQYYLSADGEFRLTLDEDMRAYSISSFRNYFLNEARPMNNDLILELKYNQSQFGLAEQITGYFPFRISKSSKYVTGKEAITF